MASLASLPISQQHLPSSLPMTIEHVSEQPDEWGQPSRPNLDFIRIAHQTRLYLLEGDVVIPDSRQ